MESFTRVQRKKSDSKFDDEDYLSGLEAQLLKQMDAMLEKD